MNISIDWTAAWAQAVWFFSVKREFDFWDFINSPFFVTVVLGLLGLTLQRRIRRDLETAPQVQKTIEASLQTVAKSQAQFDQLVEASPEAGPNVEDMRSKATEIVQQLKDRINAVIASDPDKRHHRVYERLGRTDYKVLVEALLQRGQIGFRTASALNVALIGWDAYARGKATKKAVPRSVVDLLNSAVAELGS